MAHIEQFMKWLGFGLCHQLPERSYAFGGIQAPVCVRDTGIYVGFVLGFALLHLLHRGDRPREFPPPASWAVMALLVAFMGWDGITSYAGLRATTNDMRLITGLGVGFSAAALVVPMVNDELWRRSGRCRVLDPWWKLAAWLVGVPAAFLLIRLVGPYVGQFFSALVAISIVFTLTAMNLVIVCMLPRFDRKADSPISAWAPVAVALLLAFGEIALASQVRVILLGATGNVW